MRDMVAKELARYLSENEPLLLDVREPWEYNICHLPGSRLVPMGEIHLRMGFLDPKVETAVICHHGIRSRQVAMYLEHQGFEDIINLNGGLDAWARDVDLDMATY